MNVSQYVCVFFLRSSLSHLPIPLAFLQSLLGDTRFQRRIQLPAHPYFTFLPTVDPLFQIRAPVGKPWLRTPAHGRPRSPTVARARFYLQRPWARALNSIYNTISLFVLSPYPFLICAIPLSFPYLGFPFIYLFSANSVLGFIQLFALAGPLILFSQDPLLGAYQIIITPQYI